MLQTSQRQERNGGDLVSIVELINHTRKQVYVCSTMLFTSELLAKIKNDPPRELVEWSESDMIDYRTLEYGLPRRDARAFLKRYRASISREGWRVEELPEP
jgi:hypothetical protein